MTGIIIFDFDGTITTADTINTLASLPMTHHHHPVGTSRKGYERLWEEIVEGYIADHVEHTKGYCPGAEARTTLEEELEYLESLRGPEGASIEKVSRGGLFAGLRGEDFRGFGEGVVGDDGEGGGNEKVALRRGFRELVSRCRGEKWEVGVVSVNWSREFIRGVIADRCFGGGEEEVEVVANGIEYPEGIIQGPEGLGGGVMMTAGDKLRGMELLRDGRGGEQKRVVYFGDSTTDLACLVEADLGVVVADEEEGKLLMTLRRIGFGVPHVGEYKKERDGRKQGLVWARDFEEVMGSGIVEGLLS